MKVQIILDEDEIRDAIISFLVGSSRLKPRAMGQARPTIRFESMTGDMLVAFNTIVNQEES